MIIFVGATGSGKTYAALETAWLLDRGRNKQPRFNIDRVVFSAKEFMDLVKKKMPKGSVIVWDETGIGINARLFYEQNNLAISYTTQTFRFKNYIIIYTVPSFNYIDKQVRQLFHARIRMFSFDQKKGISKGEIRWIDYNSDTGKIYYKIPRIRYDGQKIKITRLKFKMPPKPLVEQYEEKRKAVMEKLYIEYHALIGTQKGRMGGGVSTSDASEVYNKIKEKISDYLNVKNKIMIGKIMVDYGMGRTKAAAIAQQLQDERQKKGK